MEDFISGWIVALTHSLGLWWTAYISHTTIVIKTQSNPDLTQHVEDASQINIAIILRRLDHTVQTTVGFKRVGLYAGACRVPKPDRMSHDADVGCVIGIRLSPVHLPMPRPILPLELHKLIIDFIGEEFVSARLHRSTRKDSAEVRGTLLACSLVCKEWHREALQHRFYTVNFSLHSGDQRLKRYDKLFRILESNPFIKQCIRRAEIIARGEILSEDLETLCNAISPLETICVVAQPADIGFGHRLPRPSLLDGLPATLLAHHTRHFSVRSDHFPLHLLENMTNLRSLTLQGVEDVESENGRVAVWRSSTLERLILAHGRVLTQLWTAVNGNPGLHIFFKNVKYLDMDLFGEIREELLHTSPWRPILARWTRLETLVFRWAVIGKFIIRNFDSTTDQST